MIKNIELSYWSFKKKRLQQQRKIPFLSQQWASFGVSQHDIITSVNLTCMPNKVSAQRAYRDLLCAAHEPPQSSFHIFTSQVPWRQFGPPHVQKTLFRPIPFGTLSLRVQNWGPLRKGRRIEKKSTLLYLELRSMLFRVGDLGEL